MAEIEGTVHVISDDTSQIAALAEIGRVLHLTVRAFPTSEAYRLACTDRPLCVIFANGDLGQTLPDAARGVPIIALTDAADVSNAVNAMRAGATNVLERPVSRGTFLATLRAIIGDARRDAPL